MRCLCGYECDDSGYDKDGNKNPFVRIISRYESRPDINGLTEMVETEIGYAGEWHNNYFFEVKRYACPKCGTVRVGK